MPPTIPPAIQRLRALITGHWVTASLYTAAVLGIADLLGEGPRSAQDLAGATRADPDALRRLLRALAAQGVFAEEEDGRFAQTELSAFLRSDAAPAFGTIVDVGGGQGSLLSAILRATAAARGILVDLPHVVETARTLVAERGIADRCELVGGSFFESVPAGGDAYLLKWILHDWNDADATRILRTIRAAISSTGRLIVFDRLLPERITADDPVIQSSTLADLNMLVNVTGRERTETEFRQLLAAGSFTLSSARRLPSGLGIIEGLPA